MSMDTSKLAFPKGAPLYAQRHQRKVAAEKALEACYAQVEARDGRRCRVTGAYLKPGAVDWRERREHHHLVKRSRDRGLIDDASNVILVSKAAHELITRGRIVVEGRNANGMLRFHWSPDTPASEKVITIKSRRKSQQGEDA